MKPWFGEHATCLASKCSSSIAYHLMVFLLIRIGICADMWESGLIVYIVNMQLQDRASKVMFQRSAKAT